MMMNDVQHKLLKINQHFYDQYSPSFSSTRGRIQPGVRRLLTNMRQAASILDVGCGNGTLAQALADSGFTGRYLGLDLSKGLLADAASELAISANGTYEFQQVNLADQNWLEHVPGGPYDWLVSFAVLHHIPGQSMRERIVKDFAKLVSPASRVAISVWQWQNSPRLRKRVLPWSKVGLTAEDLDPGDVLLDWRAGETIGLRYVHTFDEAELTALAHSARFRVADAFHSDGKPGNLAYYQAWQLAGVH